MEEKSDQTVSYFSTRDTTERAGFRQSLANGSAPDGGLYLPDSFDSHFFTKKIKPLMEEALAKKQELSMSDFSTLLLREFIPAEGIPDLDLSDMMQEAHNFDLPLEHLGGNDFVLRLDGGPTASFKDIAARALAKLMECYCEKTGRTLNLLVATSGDTGVAIADAFGGLPGISVTVLYPDSGVSPVQETQMLAMAEQYVNVQSLPIEGTFDDCQAVSKILQGLRDVNKLPEAEREAGLINIQNEVRMKLDQELSIMELSQLSEEVAPLSLGSANSINIWRLLPQMTQYFVGYYKMLKEQKLKLDEPVVYAVPTGNVGHLMAGIYARELGLPIEQFIVGTNANNIMANVIGGGVVKHSGFQKTSAPSMDILDPSNLERLLAFAAEKVGDIVEIDYVGIKTAIKEADEKIQALQIELADVANGEEAKKRRQLRQALGQSTDLKKYGVTFEMLTYLQKFIWVEDAGDEGIYGRIKRRYDQNEILLEPHGATADIAMTRARAKGIVSPKTPVIVLETAHPDKFPEALDAAGLQNTKHPEHAGLAKFKGRRKEFLDQKPEALPVDLARIVEKVQTLVEHNQNKVR